MTTVEEQGQKISKLKSSYDSLKSDYERLSQNRISLMLKTQDWNTFERKTELDEEFLKGQSRQQLFD